MEKQNQSGAMNAAKIARNSVPFDHVEFRNAVVSAAKRASLASKFVTQAPRIALAMVTPITLQRVTNITLAPPAPKIVYLLEANQGIVRSITKMIPPFYRH